MFYDGLHNRADIFRILRSETNRGDMSATHLSRQPSYTDVPCRIIKDSKILFEPGIILADGDTIRDNASGIVYEVTAARRISGLNLPHHRSYTVRTKPHSAAFGQTESEL